MKSLKKCMAVIEKVNRSMLIVVGITICLLTVMVFYDVIMRYFFNKPSSFGFDLSIWLTAVIAFMSGGYVLLSDENIRVDLFYNKYSDKTRVYVDIITHLFVMLMAITLAWFGGEYVIKQFNIGAVSSTGFNIAIWIKWLIVPLGGILLGLQSLVLFIKDIYFIIKDKKWEGIE